MSWWQRVTEWVSQDQHERANVEIDPTHTDTGAAPVPAIADQHYFRISVAQMFLKKKTQLLTNYYPAVHSLVQCSFGGQAVEIPNVADPSKLLQADGKGDLIARNITLLPLMPFKGGEVKVVAGLFGVAGENRVNEFVGVLGGFAKLLAVPQLSSALAIAQPLANGIQTLFGDGAGMHLGYQNTFVGAGGATSNYLQDGYIALIRQDARAVQKNSLYVVKSELRQGTGAASAPFEGVDFMLLHIETRDARDDWNELTSIAVARKAALAALLDNDQTKADAQQRLALLAAFQAPELTSTDRRRVVELLKSEFKEAKDAFGTSGLTDLAAADLQQRMNRAAPTPKKARELGVVTLQELAVQ